MMHDETAKSWLLDELSVSRETLERLGLLLDLVLEENRKQNLISRTSIANAWTRHIVDSAQLLRFAPSRACSWLDLGTGAGFPGLVVALLHQGPVTLVEERRLRADFLVRAAGELGITENTTIVCNKVERVQPEPYDVISARAFAPLERLLPMGHGFSTITTRWILPKGRNARSELEAARSSWQGGFRLEPSVTDDEAGIIVADAVQPKGRRKGRR